MEAAIIVVVFLSHRNPWWQR